MPPAGGDLEAQVWTALKTCYDPEIPVNIVDLGLVYDLSITSQADGSSAVRVQMTLTAPGCGMGTAIAADAQHKTPRPRAASPTPTSRSCGIRHGTHR